MDLDEIRLLADSHPAWRLLRARNAPLVLGFLGRVSSRRTPAPWRRPSCRAPRGLPLRRERRARGRDSRTPVTRWPTSTTGRRPRPAGCAYYPAGADEVHFDATPALREAYAWVAGLRARAFVGTESRLHTVVDLLRQMVHGAEGDPETRLAELAPTTRRDRPARSPTSRPGEVESGRSALRDRYQLFASTARELLADFREVEENFRALDRAAREQIATWDGAKGDLLAQLVDGRADIAYSDQGASFQAFYDFLLSHDPPGGAHRPARAGPGLTCRRRPTSAPASTTSGPTPASAPRPPCAASPSSCAASSTTGCGWRTGG